MRNVGALVLAVAVTIGVLVAALMLRRRRTPLIEEDDVHVNEVLVPNNSDPLYLSASALAAQISAAAKSPQDMVIVLWHSEGCAGCTHFKPVFLAETAKLSGIHIRVVGIESAEREAAEKATGIKVPNSYPVVGIYRNGRWVWYGMGDDELTAQGLRAFLVRQVGQT